LHDQEDNGTFTASTVVRFQTPDDRVNEEFKDYLLSILDIAREMVEDGRAQSLAISVELPEEAIYTNFSGGFNPVLIGAVSQLLHRLNEVD